jgi:hypothetical protein
MAAVGAGLAAKASADANKIASINQRNAVAAQKANDAMIKVNTSERVAANARTTSASAKARRTVLSARGVDTGTSSAALEASALAASLGQESIILADAERASAGIAIDTQNRVGQAQASVTSPFFSGLQGGMQGAAMGLSMGSAFGGGGKPPPDPNAGLPPEMVKMKEANR